MSVKKLPYLGILKLRDLPFVFHNCDSQPYIGSITDHPYFRSLDENDPSIFLSFYKSREHLPGFGEYSWENFLALKEKIRFDGWHPNSGSPIIVSDWGQLDGTHRLSILCHLYGPDTSVMIIDGKIIFLHPQQTEDQIKYLLNIISQLVLEKTSQISSIEDELGRLKHELVHFKNELIHAKKERDYASSLTQAATDEIEMIRAEKKAYLNSTSWKVTKPLRFIKDRLFINS